jgi:hypothetical protein
MVYSLLASPPRTYIHSTSLPCVLHAVPFSSSWLDHSNYIWQRVHVQLMRLVFPVYTIYISTQVI